MSANTHKSALVLSGGGAWGAYEVGVIRALFEGRSVSNGFRQLAPDIFTGTSVGSFNASVLAMNKGGPLESLARLHDIWTEIVADKGDGRGNGVYRFRGNPMEYLDPRTPGTPLTQVGRLIGDTLSLGFEAAPRLMNLFIPREPLIERVEDLADLSAFLDIEPFYNLIKDSIVPADIRTSPKTLSVTATGWVTGTAQEFDFPNMTDEETWRAIEASAAIPGLFPPVTLWGDVFVDGGVVLNTPIRPAVEAGATELHVVSLNPRMSLVPEGHIDNTFDTMSRVYMAMLTAKVSEDIESARWINEGIEVLERVDAGEDVNAETMQRFVRVARVISRELHQSGKMPRKLTIHRYYPSKFIGDLLAMLDFSSGAVNTLIDMGLADTLTHNCRESNCVIPAVVSRAQPEESMAASHAS